MSEDIRHDWRDLHMHTLAELALYLGGSDDSFTGDLLRLMCKADPGNRRKLADAFPREDAALRAWNAQEQPPTFGEFAAILHETYRPQPSSPFER